MGNAKTGKAPKSYELVVIGTGTAAMVAALRVRAAGKSVAVVGMSLFSAAS